jgi:hypothetical protein
MLIGVFQAYISICDVRLNKTSGVKPSNSLIEYIFLNR